MQSSDFIWLSIATLGGGILGSFGINMLIRGRRGRALLGRIKWWGVAMYYVAIASTVGGGLYWIIRSVVGRTDASGLESPWFFFGFGVVMGLPFTLPAITTEWRRIHAPPEQKKRKPATRQERLQYAKDLERQIRDFVGDSRPVHLELQGEKGDVLVFGGDFSREEGERLVAALRSDLTAVDFKRVEGKGGGRNWWVRVDEQSSPATTKQPD